MWPIHAHVISCFKPPLSDICEFSMRHYNYPTSTIKAKIPTVQ